MNIYLYKNGTEKERVDKSNFLTQVASFTGTLRDECDILNPVIRFTTDGNFTFSQLNSANYAYLEDFGRYYFITDRKVVRANVHDVFLHEDVLFTWKSGILQNRAIIDRQQEMFNTLMPDSWTTYQKTQVNSVEFPNGFSGYSYVLGVSGL